MTPGVGVHRMCRRCASRSAASFGSRKSRCASWSSRNSFVARPTMAACSTAPSRSRSLILRDARNALPRRRSRRPQFRRRTPARATVRSRGAATCAARAPTRVVASAAVDRRGRPKRFGSGVAILLEEVMIDPDRVRRDPRLSFGGGIGARFRIASKMTADVVPLNGKGLSPSGRARRRTKTGRCERPAPRRAPAPETCSHGSHRVPGVVRLFVADRGSASRSGPVPCAASASASPGQSRVLRLAALA